MLRRQVAPTNQSQMAPPTNSPSPIIPYFRPFVKFKIGLNSATQNRTLVKYLTFKIYSFQIFTRTKFSPVPNFKKAGNSKKLDLKKSW
jgi:hypothetical protein